MAPDETLRDFDAVARSATHVKFVVTNEPVHRPASFQGDQDIDPANNADCHGTHPRASEVHAAEVEVFLQTATVETG